MTNFINCPKILLWVPQYRIPLQKPFYTILKTTIKNITERNHIIFYTCYVDDILIIYNHTKITPTQILHYVNTIYTNLQFELAFETEASINFLDLIVDRTNQGFEIIYRKTTLQIQRSTTILITPLNINQQPFVFF